MRQYKMTIDSGEGGTEAVQARNVRSAMNKAIRWAKQGDWQSYGEVIVRVHDVQSNAVLAEEYVTVGDPSMPKAERL